MIKINLLPPEAGKRSSGGGAKVAKGPRSAFLPLALVLVILYGIGGYGAYWLYDKGVQSDLKVKAERSRKDRKEREVKRLQEEVDTHTADREEIEEKYEVARALSPENRVFWSEKLNMIARSRIDLAVYVTKLQLKEKVDEVETPESVKRREEWKAAKQKPTAREPNPVKRPIINQSLTIEALAYGNDTAQRLRQVSAFQEALQNLKWQRENGEVVRFMDGMRIDFGQLSQKLAVVGGVEVWRFGFVVVAEPQLDRTPTTTGGGPARTAPPAGPGGKAK
jgi:hypothetical protein